MPCPGTTWSIAASMSATESSPCARSASAACSWVTPAGICAPKTPANTRSVAPPRIFGPIALSSTLPTANATTAQTTSRSGAMQAQHALRRGDEVLRLLGRHPDGGVRRAAAARGSRAAALLGGALLLGLELAHAASSVACWLSTIST